MSTAWVPSPCSDPTWEQLALNSKVWSKGDSESKPHYSHPLPGLMQFSPGEVTFWRRAFFPRENHNRKPPFLDTLCLLTQQQTRHLPTAPKARRCACQDILQVFPRELPACPACSITNKLLQLHTRDPHPMPFGSPPPVEVGRQN